MQERLKSKFSHIEYIGEGSLGVVHKARKENFSKFVAVKYIKATTLEDYGIFTHEISLQTQLVHSTIIPIESSEFDQEKLEAYYTMPFLPSLRVLMKANNRTPTLKEITKFTNDIAYALDFAKRKQAVSHNRIKPENIFYSEETNQWILADWSGHISPRKNKKSSRGGDKSFSRSNSLVKTSSMPVSFYEAPEARMSLEALSKDKISYYKADIYSLGIVVLEYAGIEKEKLRQLNAQFKESEYIRVQAELRESLSLLVGSQKFADVIHVMLSRWSYNRPSSYEILFKLDTFADDTLSDRANTEEDSNNSRSNISIEKQRDPRDDIQRIRTTGSMSQHSDTLPSPTFDKTQSYPESSLLNPSKETNVSLFRTSESQNSGFEEEQKGQDEDVEVFHYAGVRNANQHRSSEKIFASPVKHSAHTGMQKHHSEPLKINLVPDKLTSKLESLKPNESQKGKISIFSPKSARKDEEEFFVRKDKLSNTNFSYSKPVLVSPRQLARAKDSKVRKSIFDYEQPHIDQLLNNPFKDINFLDQVHPSPLKDTKTQQQTRMTETVHEQDDDSDLTVDEATDTGIGNSKEIRETIIPKHKSHSFKQQKTIVQETPKPENRSTEKAYIFSGPIVSTSWSPSGKHLVTGSSDHSVRIFDAATNECIADLGYIHRDPVLCVSWSPEGNYIASGSEDGSLKVFNFQMNNLSHSFDELYVGSVNSVSWGPDGQMMASSSLTIIKIVDFFAKKLVHTFKNIHKDDINCISWSKIGKFLASASADHTVKIINTDTKEVYHTFEHHEGSVNALAWSRGGTALASGSADLSVKVVDVVKKELIYSFDEVGPVTSLAWSNDGKFLASGSEDCSVRIYDYSKKALFALLDFHKDHILSVSWSPDSNILVTGSKDCNMNIYDVKQKAVVTTIFGGHEKAVTALAWSHDGALIATGSSAGVLKVYKYATKALEFVITNAHNGAIKCCSWSNNQAFLATSSEDRSVRVIDIKKANTFWHAEDLHQADINFINWSPNSKFLATASNDCTIKILDVVNQQMIYHFEDIHAGPVRSLSWSSDGRKIVTCANDWSVVLLDTQTKTGEVLFSDIYWLSLVAWSNNDKYVVSGSEGGTIKVFDVQTKQFVQEIATRENQVDVIYGLSIAKNSSIIAALSVDPSIKVYDYKQNVLLHVFEGSEQDRVCSLALNKDGTLLITGLQDGSMKLFKLLH